MRKFASHTLSVFLMALCVFMAANWASAQVNTADILGTVTDSGGAVIPNVKVTITNTATNDTKVVQGMRAMDYATVTNGKITRLVTVFDRLPFGR